MTYATLKQKTVTFEWLNRLNSLGLAIWYMDDGSMRKNIKSECAILHIEGFSLQEQELIVKFLTNRGYEARLQKSGEYNILIMSVEGSDRFWTDISQHIILEMQYKLPKRFQERYIELPDEFDTNLSLQERKVIGVDRGVSAENTLFNSSKYKYDIEIEDNHNYFCEGIMVHNSNASTFGVDGCVKAGSRKRLLDINNDNAGFCSFAQTNEKLKKFHEENQFLRLYGEWLVPHTIKGYKDDAWRKFYVFDVVRELGENNMEYLTYEEYKPLLEKYELDYIPLITKLENPSEPEIAEYIKEANFLLQEGEEPEGIVVKNYDFVNKYGRVAWAKYINPNFSNGSTKHKTVNKVGEVEKKMVDNLVTEHLIEKEYSKIVLEVGQWETRLINRLFDTVYHCLITEELRDEMWNILKEFKNPNIDFNKVKSLVKEKVRKVMGDRLICKK